jgi:hypothetical protein
MSLVQVFLFSGITSISAATLFGNDPMSITAVDYLG